MIRVYTYALFFALGVATFFGGAAFQKFQSVSGIIRFFYPSYVNLAERTELDENHVGNMDIFILAGQSNMEGRGSFEKYEAPETKERVYVFKNVAIPLTPHR